MPPSINQNWDSFSDDEREFITNYVAEMMMPGRRMAEIQAILGMGQQELPIGERAWLNAQEASAETQLGPRPGIKREAAATNSPSMHSFGQGRRNEQAIQARMQNRGYSNFEELREEQRRRAVASACTPTSRRACWLRTGSTWPGASPGLTKCWYVKASKSTGTWAKAAWLASMGTRCRWNGAAGATARATTGTGLCTWPTFSNATG